MDFDCTRHSLSSRWSGRLHRNQAGSRNDNRQPGWCRALPVHKHLDSGDIRRGPHTHRMDFPRIPLGTGMSSCLVYLCSACSRRTSQRGRTRLCPSTIPRRHPRSQACTCIRNVREGCSIRHCPRTEQQSKDLRTRQCLKTREQMHIRILFANESKGGALKNLYGKVVAIISSELIFCPFAQHIVVVRAVFMGSTVINSVTSCVQE